MPYSTSHVRAFLGALMALGLLASVLPAGAQNAASVRVSVSDDSRRVPIAGAQVGLRVNRAGALTDSLGIVLIGGLAPGADSILVRFPGYARAAVAVELRPGSTSDVSVRLERDVTTLPTVTVSGKATPREPGIGFARRQRMGLGHFVTREEIERYVPLRSSDILRRVPGVRVRSNRAGDHIVNMARVTSNCRVQYYVDNMPMPTEELIEATIDQRVQADVAQGAETRARSRKLNRDLPAFTIDQIPPEWIEAIEVYRGAAEIPIEYRRPGAICGVILIWTRAGS